MHDVARVRQVLRDDRALGDELAKLLAAALGQKWDARFREKARLVKEFRTLVQMHRIQGGGRLGGGAGRWARGREGRDKSLGEGKGSAAGGQSMQGRSLDRDVSESLAEAGDAVVLASSDSEASVGGGASGASG